MVISDPDVHDGRLHAIELVENAGLLLRCSTDDGRTARFVGTGLVALKATDFRQGNIIFEVRVSHGHEAPDAALADLFDGDLRGIERGKRILAANGCVLEIECTYGCHLVALFSGDVSVESSD